MTSAAPLAGRGLYWSARSYAGPSRRGIRSTPVEMFAAGLLTLNHLLGSRRARRGDVADIEHPAFRALIERIGDRLFEDGSGCALYRCDLPAAACTSIRDHLSSRKQPITGEVRAFRARQRHEVLFAPGWVYHTAETAGRSKVIERINRQPWHQIVDGAQWKGVLPDGPRLSADMAKLLESGALRPCDASNLSVRADADPATVHHYTYEEFMGGELPASSGRRRPLITAGSPLYWVDLHQLCFKHGAVRNEGDINRKMGTGYAVTDNILRVFDDPGFFTRLMQSARGEENQVFILPLTLFVMNGRLYAHDHKRAAASLLGGVRTMLGALNQDGELARLREVGYHPTRGLFSRRDHGMLMYLTDAQMAQWGHWFFRVGGDDATDLLRGIDAGRGDWRTAATSDDDAFAVLHEQVRPDLFSSLSDPGRLRRRCLGLIDESLRMIRMLQDESQGSMSRNHLRKLLIACYIVKHEEVDRVLDGRPGAVLDRLAPYAAFLEAQRRFVSACTERDALLRWELENVGNPLPPIVNQPWFSADLRDEVARRLPVLREFMEGGS